MVVIVGGGIFGITAALELRRRRHEVTLIDPGPVPHPLAESTDISKAVRLDYGSDEAYTAWMEIALERWRAWNSAWDEPLFHEDGVIYLTRRPMAPGGFEYESYELLRRRGHRVERVDARAIVERFPAWNGSVYIDGYFNPVGGFVESDKVVARLAAEAQSMGVTVREGIRCARVVVHGSRVVGISDSEGTTLKGDHVVVCAGAWTQDLVSDLAPHFRAVGQPVFHLRPEDPARYAAARFPTFGADIARTGYYGFPANSQGIVKIANHGPGRPVHPAASRALSSADEPALRAFLRETFPALEHAPLVHARVCVYCDTHDEHFWIARHPECAGLVIASGGSGHGFKFAPLLGGWIADALEGIDNAALEKFRWRTGISPGRGEEAARHHG